MSEQVDATWVKDRLDDGRTKVINVLGPDDYAKGHVPGTPNIPLDSPDFAQRVAALVPDKQTPVVVYCASLTCEASPKAAAKLEGLGYKEVYDFKAGMAGWQEAGFEVEGRQRIRADAEPPTETEAT